MEDEVRRRRWRCRPWRESKWVVVVVVVLRRAGKGERQAERESVAGVWSLGLRVGHANRASNSRVLSLPFSGRERESRRVGLVLCREGEKEWQGRDGKQRYERRKMDEKEDGSGSDRIWGWLCNYSLGLAACLSLPPRVSSITTITSSLTHPCKETYMYPQS